MSDEVSTEYADGVAVITLNRPEARNAVNAALASGLAHAIEELDERDDAVVGIITGAGGTFSAGMDLKAFLRGESSFIEGKGFAGITQAPPRKPLIAAVEGYALAGGCEIALSCDLIVAAKDAKFGIPEVKRGLIAAAGGLLRLPRRIPYQVAMELALTGEFLAAERANELGLVNRIADPGSALSVAEELASVIAANGPMAVQASKAVISQGIYWTIEEGFERQSELALPVFGSADAREGAAAFAEKRPPRWQGR